MVKDVIIFFAGDEISLQKVQTLKDQLLTNLDQSHQLAISIPNKPTEEISTMFDSFQNDDIIVRYYHNSNYDDRTNIVDLIEDFADYSNHICYIIERDKDDDLVQLAISICEEYGITPVFIS